ncbi:MAG: outer membrane protein assembly factor BamE [Gammaproteobacteria bacterium]
MKQLILFPLVITFFSCSVFEPYKIPIPQGNIIEDKEIAKLQKGLTKDQVQYVLGTPLANTPFHSQNWYYFYSVKIGQNVITERKLSVVFDKEGRLKDWVLEDMATQ